MSLKEEQCKKVCRILDDVLANRPTERDSLIVAVRKAFKALAEPEIIHCGECTKMEVDSVFHDCWCGETGKKVWINHYCGYADRREVTDGRD